MATVDIWVAAGQSNMMGLGDAALTPSNDPNLAWEFDYENDQIIALVDPGTSTAHDASTGCCLPAFAKTFTAASGRPSIFVRTAVGGTSLLDTNKGLNGTWDTTGTLFSNAATRGNAAIAKALASGHTIASVNVLWHQGEQDCKSATTYGAYKTAYINMLSRFRTALSRPTLKMYCMRIGAAQPIMGGTTEAYWETVRTAQVDACAETNGLEMTYLRCIEFFDLNWMQADQSHYKQPGYNDMGHNVALYAADDFGFEPPVVEQPDVPQSPTSAPSIMLRTGDRVLGSPSWTSVGSFDYVVPSGVHELSTVTVYGAGAGGGSSPPLNSRIGGGGGGGGYAVGNNVAVTPGETLTVKVGAAGAFGLVSGNVQPTNGAETGLFRGATALVRVAGAGGGTNASGSTSPPGGAGGVATHGDTLVDGTAGVTGSTTLGTGGGGAASGPLGGAGGAGLTASGPGNPGLPYGGGGSGARNGYNGGAGQTGMVRIEFAEGS